MNTMVRKLITTSTLLIALTLQIAAAEGDHHHKSTPKGGKLLEKTEPHAELVVEKDRSVTINFYNHDMKPVPVTTQRVTVIADAKGGKETLQFEKKGDVLVSNAKLPEGEGYTVVVQFKQTPEAKPLNLRFKLDLAICGECKQAEYACVCEH